MKHDDTIIGGPGSSDANAAHTFHGIDWPFGAQPANTVFYNPCFVCKGTLIGINGGCHGHQVQPLALGPHPQPCPTCGRCPTCGEK